jgi:hypothetical protein
MRDSSSEKEVFEPEILELDPKTYETNDKLEEGANVIQEMNGSAIATFRKLDS